jgi:hypothetical protein
MRIPQPLFSDYPLRHVFDMRSDRVDRLLSQAFERPSLTTKSDRLDFAIAAAEIYPLQMLLDRITVTIVPDVCYTTYIPFVGDTELWRFFPGEDLADNDLLEADVVRSTLILTELEDDVETCRLWANERLDFIQALIAEQHGQIEKFNEALPAYAEHRYRELVASIDQGIATGRSCRAAT